MGNRLYIFDTEDVGPYEACRFAVVHTSLKEAKKVLWKDSDVREYCDNEYVNFRPQWMREVDVSDLEVGADLENIIGIERGVYSWITTKCPRCGKIGKVSQHDDWDMICCSECDDELYEKWKDRGYHKGL